MAKRRPKAMNPLFVPIWVRYEVAELVRNHLDTWGAFCRQRDSLQEGPLGNSPSEMHAANLERPRLETRTKLLDLALKVTGPVRYEGRLFTSAGSTFEDSIPADASVQDARNLFVEIHSPMSGGARKA
jgi:hypothetical protein